MKFKKLELKQEGSWLTRFFKSAHNKRTLLLILIGMIGGTLYFYFTEGQKMDSIAGKDIIQYAFMGGFIGFFINNSPCARGKC